MQSRFAVYKHCSTSPMILSCLATRKGQRQARTVMHLNLGGVGITVGRKKGLPIVLLS